VVRAVDVHVHPSTPEYVDDAMGDFGPACEAYFRTTLPHHDVLEMAEVEKPALADDLVLVKVRAASVNPADWYGVAGPLIDQFFLGGKFDRREIVATKAMCQVVGHGAKLVYFGSLIDQAASVDPIVAVLAIVSSMVGTTLAKRVLEAMSDQQYRRWANGIITAIAGYYVVHGTILIVLAHAYAR